MTVVIRINKLSLVDLRVHKYFCIVVVFFYFEEIMRIPSFNMFIDALMSLWFILLQFGHFHFLMWSFNSWFIFSAVAAFFAGGVVSVDLDEFFAVPFCFVFYHL